MSVPVTSSTVITGETFDAYVQALLNHDWYYEYSDDHRVWTRGLDKQNSLTATAKTHPVYMALMNLVRCGLSNRPAMLTAIAELRADTVTSHD